jgi:hypothetical protein
MYGQLIGALSSARDLNESERRSTPLNFQPGYRADGRIAEQCAKEDMARGCPTRLSSIQCDLASNAMRATASWLNSCSKMTGWDGGELETRCRAIARGQ